MSFRLDRIEKSFAALRVLDGISMEFTPGKVTAVLGPSGCGKTTLLNIIAGLLAPDSGVRTGFGEAVFSFVFQEPRLIPSYSALKNIELVLRSLLPKEERQTRALHFLASVGLESSALLAPGQLSGGMRQRVALARAFAYPADILLMDEPFQSVDLKTRIGLMDAFLALQAQDPRTVVVVTHEIKEALYLGDVVTVLSDKPAHILDTKTILLPHGRRRYGSSENADIEASLYGLILGEGRPDYPG
jgi:NitT/TauT family transport system ATP-binding protein